MLIRKTGLAPLLCNDPKILILGSLPGDRSLSMQEYYGHPRNRFWQVIAAVFDVDVPETYDQKKAMLADLGIVLWDVYGSARRERSLDTDIKEPEFNDILSLLRLYPTIRVIAANGSRASEALRRVLPELTTEHNSKPTPGLPLNPTPEHNSKPTPGLIQEYYPESDSSNVCPSVFYLPSTSPANASFTIPRLVEQWSRIKIL